MLRKTWPIAVSVPRVTTLGHCSFKLCLTFDVTLFIQVPQLMFERLSRSFWFSILPWARHGQKRLQLLSGSGTHFLWIPDLDHVQWSPAIHNDSPKQFWTLSSRSSRCNLSTRAEQSGARCPVNANALVKNKDSVATFLDGEAAVEVVLLRTLDNVTLQEQTVQLPVLLLRVAMHEPAPSAADVPGYDVVGRALGFVILVFLLSQMSRLVKFSSRSGGSISSMWLLAVWGKCSRNTWSWSHAKSRFGMSGANSSVTPNWFAQLFLRSTFDKFAINGVDHVAKKVPSHRCAEPVRWNRAMADSTRFAESKWFSPVSANDRMRSQVGSCSFGNCANRERNSLLGSLAIHTMHGLNHR